MNIIETIALGIIQGLTEFLPVSSSGHLVIFQNMLGFREPELLLDCSLHLGTLFAVCLFFRSDIKNMVGALWRRDLDSPDSSLFLWVLVGSVPIFIIGIIFKDPLEGLFGSMSLVGAMLIITGLVVGATRLIPEAHTVRTRVGILVALAVGVAQSLAIVPGISRSGATIVCGLIFSLNRDLAGRFSFLLSIPAIIGALALMFKMEAVERVGILPLVLGFAASAAVGLFALKLLMGLVRGGHMYYFAPYCWALGFLVLFLS